MLYPIPLSEAVIKREKKSSKHRSSSRPLPWQLS
uniref:Uncharacterized protein n=1 Tax=Arundo donax TaxID=35708 RepID=A0A0A9AKD7_ARUDO